MPIDRTSVQLYSVRDAVAADLPAALERIAGIGFTNVELYGFVDRAAEYAAALQQAGLAAPSGHAPVLQYEEPRPAFEAAKLVGISTLIDPHHPAAHWQSADDIARAAERMNAVAAAAAELELGFGYHNHWFELETHFGELTGLELLEQHLDPAVVLEVDTFWVAVGGASPVALLERFGDRVGFIHVKDGPIVRDTATQLPAGRGEMDVPAVLRAAPQALRVLEFDAYDGAPFDGLAESFRFVTTLEP